MRLVIFSDVHGNQYAWRAFLRRLECIQYDAIVFLGDIFGYYYAQKEIVEGLCAIKNLIWLKGNHDQLFLDLLDGKADLSFLTVHYGQTYQQNCFEKTWVKKRIASLPSSYELRLDRGNFFFCHGTPSDPLNGRCYPKDEWNALKCGPYDVVFCGHTHFRMVKQGAGKLWINVGSLGQPRDGSKSGALLFDTDTYEFQYIDVTYDKIPLFLEIQQKDPCLPKLREILERERE